MNTSDVISFAVFALVLDEDKDEDEKLGLNNKIKRNIVKINKIIPKGIAICDNLNSGNKFSFVVVASIIYYNIF
jgi:hypothetical protein